MSKAPRVGMEHRYDRKNHIRLSCTERIDHHRTHGVQVRTAMAVHNALRVASGATGVTHACGLVLVNIGRPHCRLRSCKKCFIFMHLETRDRRRYFALAVIHKDKVLHGGEC